MHVLYLKYGYEIHVTTRKARKLPIYRITCLSQMGNTGLNGPTGTILPCNSASPANSVTLILSDGSGAHVVTYLITGTDLTRDYDGARNIVARDIVPALLGFSLSCNNDLTFDLVVNADRDNTESISLKTHIRKLD